MGDASRRRWPALDIVFHTRTTPEGAADLLSTLLDDYAPTAITESFEPTEVAVAHTWRVFFPSADARDAATEALAATNWPLTTSQVDVEDEGWAERSQAALTAVHVDRIIVAPPWDLPLGVTMPGLAAKTGGSGGESGEPAATPVAPVTPLAPVTPIAPIEPLAPVAIAKARPANAPYVIIIEPSMGFGTGHHQSTRLCLRALQRLAIDGARVLDIGTGSGVLAIAAAQLGAQTVLAIDDDPDAVEAARKNVALNDVGTTVDVRELDLASLPPQQADVLLANLTGALLRRHATAILRHLAPGGRIILSGFTLDEQPAVVHAFSGLKPEREELEDGWVSLTFTL